MKNPVSLLANLFYQHTKTSLLFGLVIISTILVVDTSTADETRLTLKEFKLILKTSRNFAGKNLSGMDLSKFDLKNATSMEPAFKMQS